MVVCLIVSALRYSGDMFRVPLPNVSWDQLQLPPPPSSKEKQYR